MEVASCIKGFVVAARQYQNNNSEANTVNLQRQLEVLITVTARTNQLKCFGASQMLPTECLSCVADILNDRDTKKAIIHKCLVLLNSLAQDEKIREMLHCVFEFTPILASLLIPARGLLSDPLVADCLSLLQQITYGQRVPLHESHIEDLVNFVIKKIQESDPVFARSALGLLANLCRNNEPIQAYVKNQQKIRAVYRCLISYLSHENTSMIILSLSIITSLCLNEHLGEKLYHCNNINKTFQMILNILINGDCIQTRPYAVDLFTDIIKIRHIQESLLVYDHLPACLDEVLKIIVKDPADSLLKVFEFLIALCGVAELRRKLCSSVLSSPPSPVFSAILKVTKQSLDTHTSTALLALDFLRELWEELVFAGGADTVSSHLDQMLPMLTETLMAPIDPQGAMLKKQCQKLVKTIEILLALSEDDNLRERVAQTVDVTSVHRHIQFQFDNNHIALSASPAQSDHWNEPGVDVVLFSLKLMFKLRTQVPNMENCLVQTLQDDRVVPFLGDGLTCDIRSRVQVAVGLLRMASFLSGFPETILADCVAANNSRRSQQRLAPPPSVAPSSMMRSVTGKENVPQGGRVDASSGKVRHSLTEDQQASIQSLIDKMQMGLDVKELKPSEMISVYEQKIQSLQTREHQLEDMLEAKTLALAQADTMLVQHRSRRAQSESELSRMRCLVQESEQRSEDYRERLNSVTLELEELKNRHDELLHEVRRLEDLEEDFKELSSNYSEQSQTLEKTVNCLKILKKDHSELSETQMILQRRNESLKEQHNLATQQLAELQQQMKTLNRQYKEKETKLNEVNKSYQKLDATYTSVNNEKNEMEAALDKLRTNLSNQEKAMKDRQHQVTSLELLCQQHETAIKEKDSLIQTQKTELDKHAQIAALIHNLSSGKVPDQP